MDPRWIPDNWLVTPYFKFWPPQRHHAIVWVLGNMVYCVVHTHDRATVQDYLEHLYAARQEAYGDPRRKKHVGYYLDLI
jgi:hypothetical protein